MPVGTNQQLLATSGVGVGCCTWNSMSERMKPRQGGESGEREREKHKRVDWLRTGCLISMAIMIG